MVSEQDHALDSDTLELFASKGQEGGHRTPQAGNANGLKVRRVMQITRDLAKAPLDRLRILDLACGEGVYSIEAALRGAEVLALDARTERMNEGARAAERLGLEKLRFEQADIRNITAASHGEADVIYFLGILYHLDEHDVFQVLQNIFGMCRQFVIIDTHIALRSEQQVQYNGQRYDGKRVREHNEDDPENVRRGRLLASIDNPFSFRFTRESLFRLLHDVGFTTICESHVPLEPFKPEDRISLIAAKGEPVRISSYPWVNDKTEDEIVNYLGNSDRSACRGSGRAHSGTKQLVKSAINAVIRPFGCKIERR